MAGELERGPGPGALPDPDSVVIPDDISALEAEMWALRTELARRRRRADRRGRKTLPGGLLGRVGPMLFGSLLLVAFLTSLAGIVRPNTVEPTPPADLAAATQPDGAVGGLLPPAVVDVDGATMSLRSVRPAVIAWVPATGAQPELMSSLALQAGSYGVPFLVAGPPERAAVLAETAEAATAVGVPMMTDPASAILDAIDVPPVAGPVVVVVGTDGRIHAVVENPGSGTRLEPVLFRAAAGSEPVAR
jgi:hypothetical protein